MFFFLQIIEVQKYLNIPKKIHSTSYMFKDSDIVLILEKINWGDGNFCFRFMLIL